MSEIGYVLMHLNVSYFYNLKAKKQHEKLSLILHPIGLALVHAFKNICIQSMLYAMYFQLHHTETITAVFKCINQNQEQISCFRCIK